MKTYINKIGNIIAFKIKGAYYLEFLTHKTKKLKNTKNKKSKKIVKVVNKNGQNVPHLRIIEVILFHCNIISKDYQHDLRALHTFIPNKSFI